MNQPRPLGDIADEVSDTELVLVSNPPLARALRQHVDVEVCTPETAIEAPVIDTYERLFEIYGELDAPLAAIARTINRVMRWWRDTGSIQAPEDGDLDGAVTTLLRESSTPELALEEADVLQGAITVVDRPSFDALQRSVVPDDAQVIEAFAPSELTTTLRVAPSRYTMIEAAVDEIADPTETAIVIDPEGLAWQALRAHLHGRGIEHDRTASTVGHGFCNLLDLAIRPSSVTAGDARQVLDSIGLRPREDERARPLGRLSEEGAVWVNAVTSEPSTLTVRELLDQFAFRTQRDCTTIERAIDALGVRDLTPTRRVVADLEWLLTSGWSERGPESAGVTIVDPRAAWFVDRPDVIFIEPDRTWIDHGIDLVPTEREHHRIGWLCSSGQHQRWLTIHDEVSSAQSLIGEIDRTHIELNRQPRRIGFEPERRPRNGHDRLTKTQLNHLLRSPRDSLFSRLDDTHASPGLTRGTAIHEYAELRLAAPAALEALGREQVVEYVIDEVISLFRPARQEIEASRVLASIAVIDAYLDGVDPDGEGIHGFYAPDWRDNLLADHLDVTLISSIAEQYFVDEELGVSGLVDLIRSNTHIVDFKTGSPRFVPDLVNQGRVQPVGPSVDTQLPLYLAALRRRQPEAPLRFSYVFTDGQQGAALAGEPAIDEATRTIEYLPTAAAVQLRKTSNLERLQEAVPRGHPRRILLDTVDLDRIAETLSTWRPGDTRDRSVEALTEVAVEAGVERALAGEGCRSLIRGLEDRYEHHLFADDLDAFERFLERWRDRRASFDRNGYPLGDPDEIHLDHPRMHVDLAPIRSDEGVG